MDKRLGLEKAIRIAGSQAELGRLLRKSQGHISKWIERGRVPADQCPAIEAVTGVSCEELRPDVAWHVLRGKAKRRPNSKQQAG